MTFSVSYTKFQVLKCRPKTQVIDITKTIIFGIIFALT